MWKQIGSPPLKPEQSVLRSFTGHSIKILGTGMVPVLYRQVKKVLRVLVTDQMGSVLGRDWILALDLGKLSLRELQNAGIHQIHNSSRLGTMLQKYSRIFRDELGCCSDFKAHLYLKENSRPVFCKARPVTFALKEDIETDLDRLQKDGILIPVNFPIRRLL